MSEIASSSFADGDAKGRATYWREVRSSGMATWIVLWVAVAGSVIHQLGPIFKWSGSVPHLSKLNLWEWYIEDAAISFAYARNWFEGDGLVAFPGGERQEGYSNPTWVAMLAIGYVFGADGFQSSKVLALILGGATVVLSWLIAREVVHDKSSPAPLIAPVFLAMFPQFAFWNASGLENPIFGFLLAGGFWRVLVEARTGGYPWSSVWLLLLAVSRPEAIMYSAWGGFLAMVFAVTQGRGLRSTAVWLTTFFVPFVVYHLIRYNYFAWAFPNTYYAKLGDKEFRPFSWTSRGWKYIRNFASGTFDETGKEGTGIGWFLPVFFAGMAGLRGRRGWLVPAATITAAFCFFYPTTELVKTVEWWPKELPDPEWWKELRVWVLLGVGLVLPVSAIRDDVSRGRVLCWGSALITLYFCILSTGDWMRGYRWMNFLAVPAAVLFAAGVEELALLAQRWFAPGERQWSTPAWLVAPAVTLAVTPGFFFHSEYFFGKRETGPFSVQKRAEYTMSVQKKLFLHDVLVRNLDVDMGAHMYWSEHLMVDMAGLVDVTVAHHTFAQRAVTKEYIFDETRPEIAHVHGGWATSSKIPTYPEWKNNYFQIMPFPSGSTAYHVGNHVRRDLVMDAKWTGTPGRTVTFEDGLILRGFELPSNVVSTAKSFYVEVGLQYDKKDDRRPLRILGFLSRAKREDEAEAPPIQVVDLPIAYDWLPVDEWRPEEVFHGRFAPALDKAIGPGDWDLGFVLMGEDGRVFQPLTVPEGAVVGGRDGVEARFAAGEVRFASQLVVGEAGTGEKAAREDLETALALAKDEQCANSEAAWRLARLHLPKAEKWFDENRAEYAPVIASCWVDLAQDEESDEVAATQLARARFWDRRNAKLWLVAEEIGDRLYSQGMEAREAGDWQRAYRAFSSAVIANTSLSWARRYAEEARDHRHKLDPESVAKAAQEREQRVQDMKEKAAAQDPNAGQDEEAAPKATPRPVRPVTPAPEAKAADEGAGNAEGE